MKTAVRIKEVARNLINERGWVNVTLRDIATALKISYGNVTYHFPGKEKLLEALYADYQQELLALRVPAAPETPLLLQLLEAPRFTFALSGRYRFFFVDFLELQRQYPGFMQRVADDNRQRMGFWRQQLLLLRDTGLLRADADEATFDFLMDMSGMVRTFFFLRLQPGEKADVTVYQREVNRAIWPYLTKKGLETARAAGYFS